jgi:hypothetical protein
VPDTDPELERFVDDLAHEIRLRGVPVLRSELRIWVQDCWSLIVEDPVVSRWASEYLQTWQPAEPYRA